MYPNDVKFFKKYLGPLRQIFEIRGRFVDAARHRIRALKARSSHRDVSVHVRRTDYSRHLSVLYNLSFVRNDYFDQGSIL
jgi:hypothetical protein